MNETEVIFLKVFIAIVILPQSYRKPNTTFNIYIYIYKTYTDKSFLQQLQYLLYCLIFVHIQWTKKRRISEQKIFFGVFINITYSHIKQVQANEAKLNEFGACLGICLIRWVNVWRFWNHFDRKLVCFCLWIDCLDYR